MTERKPKRPRDPNQLAKSIVEIATGGRDEGGDTSSTNRRHIGGEKGGAARAKSLNPAQRQEIAKKAATARWAKKS